MEQFDASLNLLSGDAHMSAAAYLVRDVTGKTSLPPHEGLIRAAIKRRSEARRRFLLAAAHYADAAELDMLLLDVQTEYRIRRAARELAETTIVVENIHIIDDLLKVALRLAAGVV
jgi:hypothetical protein